MVESLLRRTHRRAPLLEIATDSMIFRFFLLGAKNCTSSEMIGGLDVALVVPRAAR